MKLAMEYQRQDLELCDLRELQAIGEQVGVKPEHVERAYSAVLTNTDPVAKIKAAGSAATISVTDLAMMILNVLFAAGVANVYRLSNSPTPFLVGLTVLVVTSTILCLRRVAIFNGLVWAISVFSTLQSNIELMERVGAAAAFGTTLVLSGLGGRDLGKQARTWLNRNSDKP